MTALLGGPAGRPDAAAAAGFELAFLSVDGAEQRVPLEEAWRCGWRTACRFAGSPRGRVSGI